MYNSSKRLKVLRLVEGIGEGSAPYNQFTLPWREYYDMTLCTFFKPDILVPEDIAFSDGGGTLGGIFSALKRALNKAEYDIVHIHSPYIATFYLILKPFMWRKIKLNRTVYTLHGSFPNYKLNYKLKHNPNYRLKHKLMFVLIFLLFRKIICCGRASFESVTKFYRILAGKRLTYIPNCADIDRVERVISSMPKKESSARPFTIVVIGRLVRGKDPFVALEAFDKIEDKNSRLIYISRGELQEELMAQIKEKGLSERVQITGEVKRDKVFEYLANSDLYVSVSRGEGLPVAVLEAMASRCPVILSDIPPHREIADGADFIPLVPPGDVAGFTQEIEKFRKMSLAKRADVGEKCRQHVLEHFSMDKMLKEYERMYLEAINRP